MEINKNYEVNILDIDAATLQTNNEKQEQLRKLKEQAAKRAIFLVFVQMSTTRVSHRNKIKSGWRRKESGMSWPSSQSGLSSRS